MPLILRIDVDKPYGRVNFKEKILSKIREDYWFPAISSLGYLTHFKRSLEFLLEENIKAHIYFRKCTLPPKEWLIKPLFKGHRIGFHAENTRNFESFKNELEDVQAYFLPEKISSFTKHGSGQLKLGKNHYPAYEPNNYLKWAEVVSIPFLFGNDVVCESSEFSSQNQFYPSMFWVDKPHRDCERFPLQWAIDVAKEKNVIVILHPGNFVTKDQVEVDIRELVTLSRQQNVSWITL